MGPEREVTQQLGGKHWRLVDIADDPTYNAMSGRCRKALFSVTQCRSRCFNVGGCGEWGNASAQHRS